MLLRLLPAATPSQPSPPTILFTLPLPNHPYTARSLPLPPNLLAHKTVCLHEDIECSNVLLGEKSSWISGVIDDVTFSLPAEEIRVNFIDGTTSTFPLSHACAESLDRVVEQVNLSFAPPPAPAPATPRNSTSSISSVSSTSSSSSSSSSSTSPISAPRTPPQNVRRSTSALLLTLLSPLLPTSAQTFPPPLARSPEPAMTSRRHRRQARSLLVDSYRRFVLPELKAILPQAYLPWAISNETSQRLAEFETLREEIDTLLAGAGWDDAKRAQLSPSTRNRTFASSDTSSDDNDSESDSEAGRDAYTPATSIFPSRPSSPLKSTKPLSSATPQAYLLTIPPAHDLTVNAATRSKYATYLARLTRIASRLSSVKRLDSQYHREEGKRKWLETLERGRATERGLRRAWSNGLSREGQYIKPVTSSRLWRSWTAEDEENHQAKVAARAVIHPAMIDTDEDESDSCSDLESDSDSIGPITPPSTVYMDRICRKDFGVTLTRQHSIVPVEQVPCKSADPFARVEVDDNDADTDLPPLVPSMSDESLSESNEWDGDAWMRTQINDHDQIQIYDNTDRDQDQNSETSSDEDHSSGPRHIEVLPCKSSTKNITWTSGPNPLPCPAIKPKLNPIVTSVKIATEQVECPVLDEVIEGQVLSVAF